MKIRICSPKRGRNSPNIHLYFDQSIFLHLECNGRHTVDHFYFVIELFLTVTYNVNAPDLSIADLEQNLLYDFQFSPNLTLRLYPCRPQPDCILSTRYFFRHFEAMHYCPFLVLDLPRNIKCNCG